jgi:hypothetical protein
MRKRTMKFSFMLCALLVGCGHARAPRPDGPATVFGRRAGALALGIAVQPHAVAVTVLGLNGPDEHAEVTVAGRRAARCGAGRYCVRAATARRVRLRVNATTLTVSPPADPRRARAAALVAAAGRALRAQRSVVIRERLADGAGNVVDTVYRMVAPHRLAYATRGAGQAIIVGGTRWDRGGPTARWQRSAQDPVDVPRPDWNRAVDAALLRPGVVSFRDPSIPAWFEVSLDPRTSLPRRERMVAPAHFMDRRYTDYGAALQITPPR